MARKLTKKQLDDFEALATRFIKRGHMRSIDPKDNEESFEEKIKRDIERKRRKLATGQREADSRDEEVIAFGFESDELEREFEKELRAIVPDPEISEHELKDTEEIGSSWEFWMTAKKTWYVFTTKYEIGAYTTAEGFMPNRLVAQVNLLSSVTLEQLQHWQEKAEPGTYVSVNVTQWGGGALTTYGTRHVIYYNNWESRLTKHFYISQEGPTSIDKISAY